MKLLVEYGLFVVFLCPQIQCGKLPSDVFGGCLDHCAPSAFNNQEIYLLKHPNAIFKRCPQTSRICLDRGSRTELGEGSAIFVENYSSLKVSDAGLLSLADNAFCGIKSNSDLEIGKHGKLSISNGRLIVEGNSKFDNLGITKMDDGTEIKISDFSQLNSRGSTMFDEGGKINMAKRSTINLESHSVLMVRDQCRLNMSENAKVDLEDGSNLNLAFVNLDMKTRAELSLKQFTMFIAGGRLDCRHGAGSKPSTIVFHELSGLLAQEFSRIHLITGQLVLNQSASLILLHHSELTVDGMFNIISGKVSVSGSLKIGENVNGDCHGDSSLIVPAGNFQITLQDVTVMEGAHCYVKRGVNDSERSKVTLDGSSDTPGFKCLKHRYTLNEEVADY